MFSLTDMVFSMLTRTLKSGSCTKRNREPDPGDGPAHGQHIGPSNRQRTLRVTRQAKPSSQR